MLVSKEKKRLIGMSWERADDLFGRLELCEAVFVHSSCRSNHRTDVEADARKFQVQNVN